MFMQLVFDMATSAEVVKMVALFACGILGWFFTKFASHHYQQYVRNKACLKQKLPEYDDEDESSPVVMKGFDASTPSAAAATPAKQRNTTERRRNKREAKTSPPSSGSASSHVNTANTSALEKQAQPKQPATPLRSDANDVCSVEQDALISKVAPSTEPDDRVVRILAKKAKRKDLKAMVVQVEGRKNSTEASSKALVQQPKEQPSEVDVEDVKIASATVECKAYDKAKDLMPESRNVEAVGQSQRDGNNEAETPVLILFSPPEVSVKLDRAAVDEEEEEEEEEDVQVEAYALAGSDALGHEGIGATQPPSFETEGKHWRTLHEQNQWKQQEQPADGWMMPLEDMQVQKTICAGYFDTQDHMQEAASSEMVYIDGSQSFTDGLAVFEPIQTDDGQQLYTDGDGNIFAAVCVKVDDGAYAPAYDPCSGWGSGSDPYIQAPTVDVAQQHYYQEEEDASTWNACWDLLPSSKSW